MKKWINVLSVVVVMAMGSASAAEELSESRSDVCDSIEEFWAQSNVVKARAVKARNAAHGGQEGFLAFIEELAAEVDDLIAINDTGALDEVIEELTTLIEDLKSKSMNLRQRKARMQKVVTQMRANIKDARGAFKILCE